MLIFRLSVYSQKKCYVITHIFSSQTDVLYVSEDKGRGHILPTSRMGHVEQIILNELVSYSYC